MTRAALAVMVAVAACASKPKTIVVSAALTVTTTSGAGPSPLDPLDSQPIAIAVTFAAPNVSHDETNSACAATDDDEVNPARVATGATADLVTAQILDILPEWDVRLELCHPTDGSSVTLHSDNNAGLGVIFGCGIPAAANVYDDRSPTEPVWTSFAGIACTATIYDQLHGRLFGGQNMTLAIDLR